MIRGTEIIVRLYADQPKKAILWDSTEETVVVCPEHQYIRCSKMCDVPQVRVGLPSAGVFAYESTLFSELSVAFGETNRDRLERLWEEAQPLLSLPVAE